MAVLEFVASSRLTKDIPGNALLQCYVFRIVESFRLDMCKPNVKILVGIGCALECICGEVLSMYISLEEGEKKCGEWIS